MVIKQAFPTTVAGLVGLNRPAVNALSELLWRYMRIPYSRVQGSGYNACTGKYCIICPGGTKKTNKKKQKQTKVHTNTFLIFLNHPSYCLSFVKQGAADVKPVCLICVNLHRSWAGANWCPFRSFTLLNTRFTSAQDLAHFFSTRIVLYPRR
jgi:hypothetical protein